MNTNTIPEYLLKGKNVIKFILFVAFFSLMFINIFTPFGKKSWMMDIDKTTGLLYTSIIVLSGAAILALSRWAIWLVSRKHTITYVRFIVWMASEILLIAIGYTIFGICILKDQRPFIDILPRSFCIIVLIVFIPYTLSYLYFALKEKDITINNLLDHYNFGHGVQPLAVNDATAINFTDEKGTLRLSVRADHLFYIESADNYLNIYYLNKEKPMRFMLRNSLKNMEVMLANQNMVRCHRSYIVNIRKVKIIRKEKEGLFLDLDQDGIPDIPVSKTYAETIVALFSN